MTTLAQLRKAAPALPEVEEGTHFGMVALLRALHGVGPKAVRILAETLAEHGLSLRP